MSKKIKRCCICGKVFRPGEWGNNPEPVKPYSSGTCCDECNMKYVIPGRMYRLRHGTKGTDQKS